MIINKVIMSSDDNPMYLDFWPIVSKIWKLKFNIEPILLYFGNNIDSIPCEYGTIIKMTTLNTLPISTQTQCARIWYAGQCNDEIVMTSDIDMLPISINYFINSIENISNDKYVHLNPINNNTYYPICYHIAKSNTFKNILDLSDSFEQFINDLILFSKGKEHLTSSFEGMIFKGHFWALDEIFISHKLNDYKENNDNTIIHLNRDTTKNNRIDRSYWKYDIDSLNDDLYFDCHSIRPYNSYKNIIDTLVEHIMKN